MAYIWLVSRIGLAFWNASPIFNNSLEPIRKTTLALGGLAQSRNKTDLYNAILNLLRCRCAMGRYVKSAADRLAKHFKMKFKIGRWHFNNSNQRIPFFTTVLLNLFKKF
jgi:hypothetical protein